MDDYLYDMGGISFETPIALPPKFKISNVKIFYGTGDPKQHVRRYLSITKMKWLDEKQILHAFPLSLMVVHQGGTIVRILAKLRCGMN